MCVDTMTKNVSISVSVCLLISLVSPVEVPPPVGGCDVIR